MAKYGLKAKEQKNTAYQSAINPAKIEAIRQRIYAVLVEQGRYKVAGYTTARMAKEIGYNVREISATMKTAFKMPFPDYLKRLRTDEAKRIISQHHEMAMSEVARLAGFGNRQSFYAAFYELMNTTPRAYRDSLDQPAETNEPYTPYFYATTTC